MAMQGTFGSGGEVVFNLRIDTSQASLDVNSLLENFKKLEMVALRYLALARRVGLPDDVDNAIQLLARLITTLRMAQLSINMLMASNPVTSAIGLAGLVMTAATLPDMLAGY